MIKADEFLANKLQINVTDRVYNIKRLMWKTVPRWELIIFSHQKKNFQLYLKKVANILHYINF
ncbi:hypothetical protein ABW365_10235 [Enterococcus avium]